MDECVGEFKSGQKVLQAAAVYGDFSERLVRQLGKEGELVVVDVAKVQLERTKKKLAGYTTKCSVLAGDLADPLPDAGPYDAVCCFLLLHEVPTDAREKIVQNLLAACKPDGYVVFVDYHMPSIFNPLKPVMHAVWRLLEPYAESLINSSIEAAGGELSKEFEWSKETSFGGLYQKVIARRK